MGIQNSKGQENQRQKQKPTFKVQNNNELGKFESPKHNDPRPQQLYLNNFKA